VETVPSESARCHRCDRPLSPGEGRPVGWSFKMLAGLSLGAVHAGMWLWEELSRDYCSRCRKWLSFLSVVLAALVVCLAFIGFRWALEQGIF
jgi:hypothetical protein